MPSNSMFVEIGRPVVFLVCQLVACFYCLCCLAHAVGIVSALICSSEWISFRGIYTVLGLCWFVAHSNGFIVLFEGRVSGV